MAGLSTSFQHLFGRQFQTWEDGGSYGLIASKLLNLILSIH
jgi:hypothetical protein